MNRRSFLLGLLSTTAAPAIAKAVPIIGIDLAFGSDQSHIFIRTRLPNVTWRKIHQGVQWTEYDSIHNGVPIRQVDSIVEMLTRENEILKGIAGDYPRSITDDNYLDDEDYEDD